MLNHRKTINLPGVMAAAGLLCLLFLFVTPAKARPQAPVAKAPIAVIYPDLNEPYRSVFAQIIGGIESRAKTQMIGYALRPNANLEELNKNLQQQEAKVVIALGRQAMQIATTLERDVGVIVGGVITVPESETRDIPVNCLSPDPALLFSQLRDLKPGVRRVFTVYDSRQNAWLMRLAKEAARQQGLELLVYEAQDLRGAVRAYQEIFSTADTRYDALWLPQDSTTVEDSAVLPLVLRESWERNIAVFSSSFGHVRRGVLFSLYPDNEEMGRHLAGMALDYLSSGQYAERGMILLHDVQTAVNLRTANHLGLDPLRKQPWGMVFPEQ